MANTRPKTLTTEIRIPMTPGDKAVLVSMAGDGTVAAMVRQWIKEKLK